MQHRDLLYSVCVDEPAERISSDNQRREKWGEDAERERNSEAFYWAACLPEKDDRGDQCGDVGVENWAERFVVRGLGRDLERFSERKFFAQSFVNENVGIHRDTNRQDDARDAWQRKHEIEHRQRADQQDDVDE